jgi:UDP-N-acetylglucosamine--N-acetylmuramyl-(pentapeptide) pyrophosphoryl-undecaprenol N-acetylglucosamine transferase
MKRIVLVGGGSGGHFYPLIAVAERLNDYKNAGNALELFYIGPTAYDAKELQLNNITFVRCPAGKRRRYFSVLNYLDIFVIFYGFFVAVYKLYVIYPDVVFSKGSHTSVPVILAAFFLRIPIVVHESDAKAGNANKLASYFARYIAISFNEVAKYFPAAKVARTGIPLRKIFSVNPDNPVASLGLPTDKPLLFVTGGSLGALRLNNLILESLDELLPHYTIFHQTGTDHEQVVIQSATSLIRDAHLLEHYFVRGNLSGSEMNMAQTGAALIISRAGSGTIFEIAQKGKPSILIPIPESVSHDQKSNAYAYAGSGAASVLEEQNFADGLLASEINRIMGNQELYNTMSHAAVSFNQSDASTQIAKTLLGIAEEHR